MSVEDRLRDALGSITAEEPPHYLVERAIAGLPPRRSPGRVSFTPAGVAAAGFLVVVVVAIMISSLGLAGNLVDGPGAEIAPSEVPPPVTDDPTPPATALATVALTQSATFAPTPYVDPTTPAAALTDRQRSDLYWNAVTDFGAYGSTYDSLAEITRDVHLIVRGRVIDFRLGEIHTFSGNFPPYQTFFGIVAVEEVLKGEAQMKVVGRIEVARLGAAGMSAADLPQHEVILFLNNYAQLREEEGVSPSEDPDDRYYYSRPNGYQAVLRNIGGVVDVVVPPGLEEVFAVEFPGGLDDEPFDSVLQQIRQVVETSE